MEAGKRVEKVRKKIEENPFAVCLVFGSLAVLLISSYSIYTLQESLNIAEKTSKDLKEFESSINSSKFNRTLEVLRNVEGNDLEDDFSATVSSYRKAQGSLQNLRGMREKLSWRISILRWVNLFSFIGILIGGTLLISRYQDRVTS